MLRFILDADAFAHEVTHFSGNGGHGGNVLRHLICDAGNVIAVNQQKRRVIAFRLNQACDFSSGNAARTAKPQPAKPLNLSRTLSPEQLEISQDSAADENQRRACSQSDLKW